MDITNTPSQEPILENDEFNRRFVRTDDDIFLKPQEEKLIGHKFAAGLIMGGALVALAFQQSPGNEAVRTAVALNVLENTKNEIAVGGVVAGLTMAIEGGTSTLIALGLNQEKTKLKQVIQKFRRKSAKDVTEAADDKSATINKLTDIGITLGVGAGLVVVKRHILEEEPKLKTDIARGLGFSAIGAVVSGGIGYLVAGGVRHADKVGLERPAELFVDYATDWKFWTALIISGYSLSWAKNRLTHLLARKKVPEMKESRDNP